MVQETALWAGVHVAMTDLCVSPHPALQRALVAPSTMRPKHGTLKSALLSRVSQELKAPEHYGKKKIIECFFPPAVVS